MPSIATVTTLALAVFAAKMVLPKSICDINQPPNMSPEGLASAGMAIARIIGSLSGSWVGSI